MKILAFSIDNYARYEVDPDGGYKNIVPLDEMTLQERYELALNDDDNVMIWDNVGAFLEDMNDELVSTNDMWFYEY